MKVILLENVKSLGKKGEIVTVNDGYARNFILPKKLGVEATSKNLNDLKLQKANAEKVAAEQLAAAKELAEKIEKLTITLSGRKSRTCDQSWGRRKNLWFCFKQRDCSSGERADETGLCGSCE